MPQLRHHIPIAAPSTRAPAEGDEPFVRISLGFTPAWYHRRLGIDLGEAWHTDPEYRYRAIVEMKEYLHGRFPEVVEFAPNLDESGVEVDAATISGVYGILLIPMLYGVQPVYSAGNWPDASPAESFTKESLYEMGSPETMPHLQALLRQITLLRSKWCRASGYMNYQGVLNVALKVRGEAIFTDFYDDPDWVRDFLTHIAESIAVTAELIYEAQGIRAPATRVFSVSNCVINLVSPDQYTEFLLPLDNRLGSRFPTFGVHTCNWNATPYFRALRTIPRLDYIDMGISSDLSLARQMFPEARRTVIYDPVGLETKSEQEIEDDIMRIAESLGPCDIALADVDYTTPDDRVRLFLELARATSRRLGQ